MKKNLLLFLFIILVACSTNTFAQDLSTAGNYITAISNAQLEMNQKYMAYMSAASHGRRARKVEKMRQAALQSIDDCRFKTIDLPLYKGDNSLRQSSIDYIKLCYNVFNDDYGKIVNLEDIAEQSYDEMQAYLLLQEQTNAKLHEAEAKMNEATKAFAAKNNINLIDAKDELSIKLDETSRETHYENEIYLLFFKCNWQNNEIVKALNAGKITQAEQGRNSLIKYASEGLVSLDTIKPFDNDPSLVNACRRSLQLYKKMGETELPKQMDYFLKKESFEKMQKAMDAKDERDRTKKDVDAYNSSLKEFNNATESYNNTNKNIYAEINDINKNWEDAQKAFADAHTPYYK